MMKGNEVVTLARELSFDTEYCAIKACSLLDLPSISQPPRVPTISAFFNPRLPHRID